MAHQLTFQVTLWSDDADFLLQLEKELQKYEVQEPGIGGSDPYHRLLALSTRLSLVAYANVSHKLDVHSIDINWDDDLEGEAPIYEPASSKLDMLDYQRLTQGKWDNLTPDPGDDERIRNLLDEIENLEWPAFGQGSDYLDPYNCDDVQASE